MAKVFRRLKDLILFALALLVLPVILYAAFYARGLEKLAKRVGTG